MKKVIRIPCLELPDRDSFCGEGKNPERTPARFLHRLKEDRKVFCPAGKYRRCFV